MKGLKFAEASVIDIRQLGTNKASDVSGQQINIGAGHIRETVEAGNQRNHPRFAHLLADLRQRLRASDEQRQRWRQVRAHCLLRSDRGKFRTQSRHQELVYTLGACETAQRMVSQIGQGAARRCGPVEQSNCRCGKERLAAVRRRHHARRARQRRPAKDFILGVFDRPGVQPHAHMDWRIVPALGRKRTLCVDRGTYRGVRIRKCDAKRVPDDTKRVSSVLADCLAEQRVVTLGRHAHRRRPSIPKRCAALDVGEQERERLRRRGSDHR